MIHCGDLFDVLPTLPAASIDACCTDPPYGLGFMGKKWDTFAPAEGLSRIVPNREVDSDNPNLKGRSRGPASSPSAVEYDRSLGGQHEFQAWTQRWATEVFRVLKPGAHLLVCGAPRSYHRMASGLEDAGFEIRDCLAWIFGQGFPKSLNFDDGWGTALKPAYEPIVLARKPFKGSVGTNREQFGTGAINIHGCRINPGDVVPGGGNGKAHNGGRFGAHEYQGTRPISQPHDLGRWPSNVALDEDAAAMLDAQSGELTSGDLLPGHKQGAGTWGRVSGNSIIGTYGGDSGGASRFFYVAKPSRAEREMGCYEIGGRQRDESRKEGNPGGDNPRNRGLQVRGNHHPTVKPIELMRWLVRLVTPVGGTVLDPFTGSGTTGCACSFEGFQFIGVEREAEYVAIAERRISMCVPLLAPEVSA